jgi:hydroxyacylglutathione hydrolase
VTLERLAPTSVRELADQGATILLDVRAPADFARGHATGALSVPFSGRGLARRVGSVLPRGASVVIVAPEDGSADAAAAQLGAEGIRVRGALAGGFDAWRAAGFPEAVVREVAVEQLPERAADATLVDVREPLEWATGFVPGALLIPLGQLRDALPSIPRTGRVIAICEAGIRSSTAASILAAADAGDVAHVPAGTSGYRRAGLPLAFPAPQEVGTA